MGRPPTVSFIACSSMHLCLAQLNKLIIFLIDDSAEQFCNNLKYFLKDVDLESSRLLLCHPHLQLVIRPHQLVTN